MLEKYRLCWRRDSSIYSEMKVFRRLCKSHIFEAEQSKYRKEANEKIDLSALPVLRLQALPRHDIILKPEQPMESLHLPDPLICWSQQSHFYPACAHTSRISGAGTPPILPVPATRSFSSVGDMGRFARWSHGLKLDIHEALYFTRHVNALL